MKVWVEPNQVLVHQKQTSQKNPTPVHNNNEIAAVQSITSIEPRDGPSVCSPFSTAQHWRTTPETDAVPEHKVSGTVKDFVSFLSLQLFKYPSASLAPDAVSCGCH